MKLLLDSEFISDISAGTADQGTLQWLNSQRESTIYISVLALADIQKKLAHHASTPDKKDIKQWIVTDLKNRFQKRILDISPKVAIAYGQLQAKLEKTDQTMEVQDALLAATALAFNLIIVTTTPDHYEISGVSTITPHNPGSK